MARAAQAAHLIFRRHYSNPWQAHQYRTCSLQGGGPALSGLLAGEVHMVLSTAVASMPHVKTGKLRALGIISAKTSALVPGVLPIATSLPRYESVSMTAMFAPAKTPAAIINRVNQEVVRALHQPE